MKPDNPHLAHHLAMSVALKLVVITALWLAFVPDARVEHGATLIFTPLIVFYISWACRVTRGKVTVAQIRANEHTAC